MVGGAASLAVSMGARSTAAHPERAVAKTFADHGLGKMLLVSTRGLTLYALSAETHGRFICTTTSCLATWKPLVVPAGTHPTGARALSTIKRPDGRTQVTYRGRPLYRFAGDRKAGDTKGNGFKDVGTWAAVAVGATTKTSAPAPSPAPMPTTTYPGY
jgi:predicted lipoprotein with Yx(FWY)xxD motif